MVKKNQGRVLKKEPTPPLEGMKFGEYEEYKREQEPDRKRQYKEDLEKQKREQALIKLRRDFPNKQPLVTTTPRQGEVTDRKGYRNQIEEKKQKQFSKMLAQQPTVRDVRPQNTQPRRRSPSPEFSDPGMQLQADRIRARIRDLPTRPEEVEELQRRQQQQDALQRDLEDISPRNSYEERRPPVDLSPRLDDYGPGLSDRYPPPQEDYRQPPQHANQPGSYQGSRPQAENKIQERVEHQLYDESVRKHVEVQRRMDEEAKKRRQAEHQNDENIRKQLEIVKRRQELEEKRKVKQRLEENNRRQFEEERRRQAERRMQEQAEKEYQEEMRRQIADKRQRDEEEKRLLQVKHQESVMKQIVDKNRQEAEEKKRLRKEQGKDEGILKQLEKGREREADEKRRKREFEEEQNRQLEESRRSLEEGRPSTVHVRFSDYEEEEAVPRRRRPNSEYIPGYGVEQRVEQRTKVHRTATNMGEKCDIEVVG
ncbi:trichohyalin-like [Pecten maximus]|uniref:trichohyalin-like n=1 Tax=Pecten maximus TaxID=6579 RepID=UPI0014587664|nr:trichohyalin-like [Pecten maximus]